MAQGRNIFRKGGLARKTTPKGPASLWDFLNSPFGVAVFSGVVIAGLGSLFTYGREVKGAEDAQMMAASKLLSESRFRFREVRLRATEMENATRIEDKQAISRFIYAAAMAPPTFQTLFPESKGVHWAGVLTQLDTLEPSAGSNEAIQSAQGLEQDFVNNGANYFDKTVLETHLAHIVAYQDRVDAKLKEEERPLGWLKRKLR